MPVVSYPHIQFDGKVAKVGNYKILHLASEHYCYGWSAEEIMRQHSDLTPEEVYSALGYFYDHYEEIVVQIKSSAQQSADLREQSSQPSRSALLRRRRESNKK